MSEEGIGRMMKIDPPGTVQDASKLPPGFWTENLRRLTEIDSSFVIPREFEGSRKSAYACANLVGIKVSVRRDENGELRCRRIA